MATVKQVIEKTYTKVNGEYEVVEQSSDEFRTALTVLNMVMSNLAHTPYLKLQTFFDMNFTLGTVVDDTLSYDIPNSGSLTLGNSPYDHVYFVDGAGEVVQRYKIVDVAMFQSTNNVQVCAVSGGKLWLKSTPASIVGTTIRVPAYVDPVEYTTATQEVVVDSLPWLIASMAAFICDSSPVPFIARNADKYAKEAAIYMKEIRDNNRKTQALIIKSLANPAQRTWSDVMNVMTMKDL